MANGGGEDRTGVYDAPGSEAEWTAITDSRDTKM